MVVHFDGEDGRSWDYRVDQLPLPGWHQSLAAALHQRIGLAGGLRTVSSVTALWDALGRFIRFLDALPDPPLIPADLTVAQVIAFHRFRRSGTKERYAWVDVRVVGKLLTATSMRGLLATEVIDFVTKRTPLNLSPGKPGYSDRELRLLMRAARSDVERIRDRVSAGHDLAARYRQSPQTLAPDDREQGQLLARISATGAVPKVTGPFQNILCARVELAGQLFLTTADVTPLLTLLVGVTGRNVETIKELPVEHRILEGRAVELRLIKRRRGPQRWSETVTWEIGQPGHELRTPGGIYLLLHRLTSAGRRFSGEQDLWSIWRNGHRAGAIGSSDEHISPFRKSLIFDHHGTGKWVAQHGLTADQPEQLQPDPVVLKLDFTRLKTSIDVRRTKEMGGHLPSAAKTNTIPVLFRNYLRNDPTTVAWAQEVFSEGLVDAEKSALAAHRRALERAGGSLTVVPGPTDASRLKEAGIDLDTAHRSIDGQLDTAWSACTDYDHHPLTSKPCRESFLDCFQCGNCLITRDHLPRLLGLLDAMAQRREQLSENDWWARYGMSWAAIRQDVLSKFSPAEVEQATRTKTTDALLDLVEKPWEKT
ncbi:hypothetical protein ACFXPS_17910 [Nocardia sp. NPDC059091]|uniref:hypothetical protein n=1 Tax=Nocardia sp. NPDC059091 TaxID=3346724 RepID=UPI0036B972CC